MRTTHLALLAGLAFTAPSLADDLYALSGNISPVLYTLDPVTGSAITANSVTGQEALFGGLGADTAGNLYSIDGYNDPNSDRLFAIDRATGAGAVVGPTRFNWNFRCLALNPANGVLYATTDNNLYTMNLTTGEATLVTPVSGDSHLDQLTAIAFNAAGQAYITDIGSTDLFSLDLQSGQATWIGSVGGDNNWFNDLAFDSSGVLHGARFNGGVYSINLATAAQTFEFNGTYTGLLFAGGTQPCYANCDESTTPPALNVLDFTCFLNQFAAQNPDANCDESTTPPVLNVLDFTCFLNRFAAGCP